MKDRVTVSILLGVYNPGNGTRLWQAVESIRQQRFSDWELLLYDDGSTAVGAELIREVGRQDPRICCLRGDQNRGLAHALNVCIRHAAGRFLARMDDDDIALPDRLQKQVAFLQTHPQYHWVGSCAALVDRRGVWGMRMVPPIPQPDDFLFNSPYIHPSVMFRREVLLRAGGYRVSEAVGQCEDYELFMRLHRDGYRGYNLQEPLLWYWEDETSYQKRTYRRRVQEMRVRYRGFQELGILRVHTLPYVVKPLLVGLVPAPVYRYLKRRGQ